MTARAPTAAMEELGPKLREVASLVGRRADDPEIIAYVTRVLGKKVPQSTSTRTDAVWVEAPRAGLNLLFAHYIEVDGYPPIPNTRTTFIPYLVRVDVQATLSEPVLGLRVKGATVADITAKLGEPTLRAATMLDDTLTVPTWTLELDSAARIRLEIAFASAMRPRIELARAATLERVPDVGTAVFLAWAATHDILDEARFAPHAALLAAVKKREAKGSDLRAAALPHGLWDDHLRDAPGMRVTAYRWFHNMKGAWITADLERVFGKRKGEHGHDEPLLDDDTWEAVDKAASLLNERFAMWTKKG